MLIRFKEKYQYHCKIFTKPPTETYCIHTCNLSMININGKQKRSPRNENQRWTCLERS